ncbi:NAD(P)H-dependent glycerol-3-phosphate dehydrogenase [Denitratisoma oestradiolicum]|uniref:Glycerol-3-phosphate dehydrogenase [NAD(P)+] n=1 Tax=Denitratisoma oestradiolicum TaxID=311182 RepID=A0A6S6XXL7_9PROT|nr:NAD(P)H-dependent glycerol-3-phosphate dehydrogenase [Denitratisoma oestradiolicum]TWO80522.1 glycerol-3-phosphate dehydrogenase [Denitratisoma oestradiolicum]CAB1367592.1 glycerol-3-phosphate dehydrogenase (NAD+) [Denitratisoma oestradiolicum]
MKIAVLGAGAWGTALAISLAARHRVTLWSRDSAQVAAMAAIRENRHYLPGCPLPEGLAPSADFESALQADVALVVTPLAGLRETLARLARAPVPPPFLWACKGLEAGTGLLPHQVVAEVGPGLQSGVLTGPSFAEEVARGLPAAVTIAAADGAFARDIAQALNSERLRLYANDDLVGAEVGGAVKNVLAIACGISDGLGLGLNARAALVTRGLAEITRFGLALGARRETFMGLAGMGDLILTCTGDLSRNRRVGLALAGGDALEAITRNLGHVAEGVSTAREVARRARALEVDMPITDAVCAVLEGQLTPAAAVAALMAREPKAE